MNSENPQQIFNVGFDVPSIRMLPYWRICVMVPEEEVDDIYDEIIKVAPLVYGKTDRNAIRSASCYEYYRPLEGTPTGAEEETRRRPGIVELAVSIPSDEQQLGRIVEVIYQNQDLNLKLTPDPFFSCC